MKVKLTLLDTNSSDQYVNMRRLSYEKADVVLVCFAIDNCDSLENVITKLETEVRLHCPNVPFILVGNKCDFRKDLKKSVLSVNHCVLTAKKMKAVDYMECSALTGEGVNDVLQRAVKETLKRKIKHPRNNKKLCHIS